MAVYGQFHALDIVFWVKVTLFPQSRRLDGPQGRAEILGKSQMFCNCQIRNPGLSARRINTVLSFIIIAITAFWLNGLDFKVLTLKDESYIIYEAKEPVGYLTYR